MYCLLFFRRESCNGISSNGMFSKLFVILEHGALIRPLTVFYVCVCACVCVCARVYARVRARARFGVMDAQVTLTQTAEIFRLNEMVIRMDAELQDVRNKLHHREMGVEEALIRSSLTPILVFSC